MSVKDQLEILSGLKQTTALLESNLVDQVLTVNGYMSIYGNTDSDGDIVVPGAFDKFLDHFKSASQENPEFLPLLYRHRWDMRAGFIKELKDDGRGILVTGIINQGTNVGRFVSNLVKDEKLNGFSYHFFNGLGYMKDGTRYLTQLFVDEVTLTPEPANDRATLRSFKHNKDHYKAWKSLLLDTMKQDFGLTNKEARSMFAEGIKSLGIEDDRTTLMLKIITGVNNRVSD